MTRLISFLDVYILDCDNSHFITPQLFDEGYYLAQARPIAQLVEAKIFTVAPVTSTDQIVSVDGMEFSGLNNDKDVKLSDCAKCLMSLALGEGSNDTCFTMRRTSNPGTCFRIRKGETGSYLNEISVNGGSCTRFSFFTETEYQEKAKQSKFCGISRST